ncbi:hypothetical protein PF005_g6765 [Phytophthora fragariae]|uniref:ABC transmembrane type-1 domain-containing protein n=1 Tax=Phytophthora fragariae TaxID=53985 RepID=A0A6A3LQV4_9STRA|nr:hypothetical protein PF003_g3245 [Phytophthora fragariae]KAE9021706.1 hypothetical protein PF011_g4809 [Phytophthora fragariae]KAE9123632.1 hypothetical protein PF007_g6983 [Phytophthora fragariae]KAE9124495.1 hypothetical protein PF010_g5979 [Phytophthora fragariae]KAE9149440.1 hypothetical protein PF006_g6073 [Phytophthora fragariae]
MLAVFSFLIMGQAARGRQMKTAGGLSDELSEVRAHASEALSNIRTVASLGLEKSLSSMFSDLLEKPLTRGRRQAHVNGFALGFSSFILFAAYALAFWFGGKLVDDGDITFKELVRTLMAFVMAWRGHNVHRRLGSCAQCWKSDREPSRQRTPINSFDESSL